MSAVMEATPRSRRVLRVPTGPATGTWVALVLVVLLAAVVVTARGGDYFTQANMLNMLSRTSALGIVAIGQTVAILAGSLDLSVAYLIGLTSLIAAEVMGGDPAMIVPAVLAVLAVSALVGLVNGLVITRLHVNAFIATLGVGLVLKGIIESRYEGPAGAVPVLFQRLGYDRIGPIPISVLLMLGIAVAMALILHRTRTGHHVYAVGGSVDVARLSGVSTTRTTVVAHVLCSLCAGLAGLYLASRLGAGAPYVGTDGGYDLESIAAVVLGGTVLAGGRGGVGGTVAGVLLLAVLDNLFDQLVLDAFFKDVVRGAVIILAVAVYARRQLRDRAGTARRLGTGGAA
ncbi:ABC transporter permease [Pseudonocardia kunmingensis]|uniref:Ribose transport system permease protein n=1 Tax=Pseudonocardia kunmingensis TaxID=630975 RepID=A0A543DQB7_9PSEU|nr:ABC transporter permease [Pseudonocardia kunmingensis]TQM11503.1 ribose transport system permease protein [Pseudonocardia kunmingensis]